MNVQGDSFRTPASILQLITQSVSASVQINGLGIYTLTLGLLDFQTDDLSKPLSGAGV